MRCLAKEPSQRYPSAAALVIALARALSLPASLEFVSDASTEEEAQQQSVQDRESMWTQPDAAKPLSVFPKEQTGQVPATSPSTNGSAAFVLPVASVNAPVRKVPNPETPLPPVDAMASLFPPSQSLSQPSVAIHSPRNNPVPPKRPKGRRWGRTGILLLVLLVLMIISSLTWLILPKFYGGTGVATSTAVGRVSFFSTKTRYFNKVDGQNEHAINDGLQGTFHLATPASGDSYYAWLRTSFADSSGMYLTAPGSTCVVGNTPTINCRTTDNALTTSGGLTTLYYRDANQRNLLAPIDANHSYQILTIGEQRTTATPLLEAEKVRYQAVIPDQASPTIAGTYLVHIQHLLSSDPDIDNIGLRNGLDYWFLKNVNTLETLTEDIQNHTNPASLSMVQQWIITSLYYLDGKCATDDIKQVNPTLNSTQQNYTLDDTQVSLLNCSLTPVHLGYINHMGIHLNSLEQISGVTTAQKQQIERIKINLSRMQMWLGNVRKDVLQLIQTYMNDLGNTVAMQLRYDMANYAELALSGQLDPRTQQVDQGASLICDSIQQLASMSVTKV